MILTLLHELRGAPTRNVNQAALRKALRTVVDGDADLALAVATELLESGTFQKQHCLKAEVLSEYSANLVLRLAESYVLIALLSHERGGHRQVIKYAHHSEERLVRASPARRFLVAAGIRTLRAEFALSHPEGSASHHFELVVPEGITCVRLTMPGGYPQTDRNTGDGSPSGVAHAVASYARTPTDRAAAEFAVPFSGLRSTAMYACFLTAGILLLGLLLPGAQEALLDASDGAAALLLAVPAVVVVLVIGGSEHVIVTSMLRPLRSVVIACALLLLACAGSIVGVLHDPFRYPLWWIGAVWSFATGWALLWSHVRGR
ncbi:hypothetical protein [Cellulomonas wangsupingiae]|uniref:hypothetical protein n=1 Tax=Cellulomonas wangsupingiae TaxID=2968085 RepID=UPI001D0E72E3|nr:hypothetical protein [Cellulomonas wangsupingiae]MCM0638975.1 hypothetical protein [Cellulomonas wangsupingiae]